MKSDVIIVSNRGKGMDAALALTDSVAGQLGLAGRDALHMRLLAEEMMNLMRSIISEHVGQFWIETAKKGYQLHLKTVTSMSAEQRARLIAASSSGENEAHRGIMGKIRAFFEPVPEEETPAFLSRAIVNDDKGDLSWSMGE